MSERERVSIRFERKFSSRSENGKLFDWLKESFEGSTAEKIIGAVKVLLYPTALSELGASEAEIRDAVQKSRRIFEANMMIALGNFYDPAKDGVDFCSAPVQPKPAKRVTKLSIRNANVSRSGTPPEQSPISRPLDDDDVLAIDESKIFDDTNHFGGIQ